MNVLRFKINYAPSAMAVKISDFMSQCDLGIEYICIEDIFTIETKSKVTKKYIEKTKDILIKSIEEVGGKVFEIEFLDASKKLKI